MNQNLSISEAVRKSMGRRREASTINRYAQVARQFAKFTGKEEAFSEQNALSYIDFLIEKDCKENYLKFVYAALKRTYKAVGCPFTITADDLPLGSRYGDDVHRPALSLEEVSGLIAFTRRYGSRAERFYLAMSSVYGLRRIELSRLNNQSFTEDKVKVDTAKHGAPRSHLVPAEISPVIQGALRVNAIPYGVSALTIMFQELCRKVGLEDRGPLGWHSIRRSLDTELLKANTPYYVVRSFLRWRSAPGDMAGIYFQPDSEDIDRQVFQVHPFLRYWG